MSDKTSNCSIVNLIKAKLKTPTFVMVRIPLQINPRSVSRVIPYRKYNKFGL